MGKLSELFELLPVEQATKIDLKNNDVLYRQGDICRATYFIETGYLKFTHVDTQGVAMISALINAGEFFGLGVGGSEYCRHTVSAKGKTRVQRYPTELFQQALAANSELMRRVINRLAVREEIVERRLRAILTLDVRGRIAVTLRDLAEHYGDQCRHGHMVDVKLTQQEFADMIGASRPVVSGKLSELRDEDLISYERGFICVNDLRALDVMANELISEV